MDLFETLGLGPRQPEENELYVAIYADPDVDPTTELGAGDPDAEPNRGGSNSSSRPFPPGQQEEAARDRLDAVRAQCTAWLLPYISDYVWNKDPLVLRSSSRQPPPWERRRGARSRRGGGALARPSAEQSGGADAGGSEGPIAAGPREGCVWAVMRFGDAVDDEWWAVWLLLRMTRELQHLSVQVWDNDGQFLLIEAAYALPRWLKPETADNRVWLRCGRLHVIPLPSAAASDLPASPSPEQALAVLREGRYATASPRVQRPIDERLAGYPGRARSKQQHVARCLLPGPLAAVLQSEPQTVAALVEAFYLRDADDMRAASRMRLFPLSMDRVPALVRMTRCHYAQLSQQRFAPPRGLAAAMPPPDSPAFKAADLGLKLTVAAEMVCAREGPAGGAVATAAAAAGTAAAAEPPAGPSEGRESTGMTAGAYPSSSGGGGGGGVGAGVAAALSEATFARLPAWRRFKASLESNGYFQGNIPESKRYKELMAAAVEAFAAGLSDTAGATTGRAEDGVGGTGGAQGGRADAACGLQRALLQDPRRRVAELVRAALAEGLRSQDPAGQSLAEDDDSWLDQNPDRLQSELARRQAELQEHTDRRSVRDEDANAGAAVDGAAIGSHRRVQEVDADDIASKLRGFMEHLSGLEGVDTPGDSATAAGGSGGGGGGGGDGDGVAFQPAKFLRELEKVLGAALPDKAGGGRAKRRHPDGAPARAAGAGAGEEGEAEDDESVETSSSGEEGSSFFSDDDDDDEMDSGSDSGNAGEEGEGEGEVETEHQRSGHGPRVGQPPHPPQVQGQALGRPAQSEKPQPRPGPGPGSEVPARAAAGSNWRSAGAQAVVSAHLPDMAKGAAAVRGAAAQPSRPLLKRGFLSGDGPPGQPGKLLDGGAAPGGRTEGKFGHGGAVAAAAVGERHVARSGGATGSSSATSAGKIGTAGASGRLGIRGGAQAATAIAAGDAAAAAAGVGETSGVTFGAGRGLRWEVDTETDSDDDEEGGRAAGGSGSEGEPGDDREGDGDEDEDATAQLLAALGVGEGETQVAGVRKRNRQQRGRKAGGGADSEEEKNFMAMYDDALAEQLAETTLAHTFEAGPPAAASRDESGQGAGPAAGTGLRSAGATAAALHPVELDMNLVRNLLRSYTAQQGTAGPAGNIAGMLGLPLVAGDVED